jgi:hypothetical protein
MCWTTSFLWCIQSTTNGRLRGAGFDASIASFRIEDPVRHGGHSSAFAGRIQIV